MYPNCKKCDRTNSSFCDARDGGWWISDLDAAPDSPRTCNDPIEQSKKPALWFVCQHSYRIFVNADLSLRFGGNIGEATVVEGAHQVLGMCSRGGRFRQRVAVRSIFYGYDIPIKNYDRCVLAMKMLLGDVGDEQFAMK